MFHPNSKPNAVMFKREGFSDRTCPPPKCDVHKRSSSHASCRKQFAPPPPLQRLRPQPLDRDRDRSRARPPSRYKRAAHCMHRTAARLVDSLLKKQQVGNNCHAVSFLPYIMDLRLVDSLAHYKRMIQLRSFLTVTSRRGVTLRYLIKNETGPHFS